MARLSPSGVSASVRCTVACTVAKMFLARCSASRPRTAILASCCRRSLMSRAIFDAPTILPSALPIGETVSETSTGVPSLRTRTVSKWSIRSPRRRRSRIVTSSPCRSGGMMMVIDLPTTSSAE